MTVAVEAVRDAFAAVAVETLTVESLKTASGLAGRLGAMVDGFRADLARKGRDLAAPATSSGGLGSRHGRGCGVDDALNPNGRRPHSRSDRDEDRADLFDHAPELANATRDGELPGDYADVVNQQLRQVSAGERHGFLQRYRNRLVDDARAMTLHAFRVHIRQLVADYCAATAATRLERQRSRRSAKVWEDTTNDVGMIKLFATFDPETGARLRKAVDEEVDRIHRAVRDDPTDKRTTSQTTADAVANLILGARTNTPSRTELVVICDLDTLTGNHTTGAGRRCETADGTPLPVETVRRLACEADIVPAVLNSDSVLVDLGRSQRLASKPQRLALQVMYGGCAFDGCAVSSERCEIHHIDPWSPPTNGPTDLDNLIPVCQRHHHLIHDHHWQLTLNPHTRTLTEAPRVS